VVYELDTSSVMLCVWEVLYCKTQKCDASLSRQFCALQMLLFIPRIITKYFDFNLVFVLNNTTNVEGKALECIEFSGIPIVNGYKR